MARSPTPSRPPTGATFDSGALSPGASFSYTTKKAGTIAYLCSFHQGMTGQIVVE